MIISVAPDFACCSMKLHALLLALLASTNALKCIEMEAQAMLSCKGDQCPQALATSEITLDLGVAATDKEPHLKECKATDDRCLTYSFTANVDRSGFPSQNMETVMKMKKSECGNDKSNCAEYKKKEGTSETEGGEDKAGRITTTYASTNDPYGYFECTETTVDATAADLKAADAAHDSFEKDEKAKFNSAGQVVPSAIAFVFAAAVSMLM
jgi:hypothetical protein